MMPAGKAPLLLTGLISILALCCAFGGVLLLMSAGFVFADIDYNEEQWRAAETRSAIFSVLCVIEICASVVILFLSNRISRLIVELPPIRLRQRK